ncbi:MAG: clostripain-related cysteine peptidase [Dehalococcoidales bacterium]|nr:clostripain-related cysteine peptidase [Dehalococcoidales bacterium]
MRRTITAGRRRRPSPSPSGGRDRAEAPRREVGHYGGSSGGGDMGGGTYSGGGRGLPFFGGKSKLSIIMTVVALAIIFGIQYCGGLDFSDNGMTTLPTESGNSQITDLPAAGGFVSNYPDTSIIHGGTEPDQTWLVMLYQDADDKILEKDICLDTNEAEKAGSSSRVRIVSQLDRYSGGYTGDGDWTGTKRFLISRDDNLSQLGSQQVAEPGEVNMSDGKTLVDFATWAIKTYPSDKYVLILSDHGMGWPGGWSDANPKGTGDPDIPLASLLGDELYLHEIDDALSLIRANTDLDKFELIGMDACLMGQLEVFTTLEPHARYAVASEEVEPALGWAYTSFLQALNQNPDMNGAELCQLVVKSYIEDDQSILDSSARGNFLSQGSPFGGLFGPSGGTNPAQMAREIGRSSTLGAVDLSQIGLLNESLNGLVFALQEADQRAIASSRTYSQSFTSIFGSDVSPSFIDLGNFLEIVKQKAGNTRINQAVDAVLAAIDKTVIAEKHGVQKPGATGIAIYFPNSELYRNAAAGAESYTAIAGRFAKQSLWDDFLAYHYTGNQFSQTDTQAVVPPTGSIRAPAAGGITISPVAASSSEAAPGQPVTLSADISGENIGYIYLFVGFYDRQANSIFVADQDYLESPETRQVNGVYYPDWGEGDFTLQFTWEPVVFAISNGTTSIPALFKPESYGRSFEEAVYVVDGIYTYSDGDEQRAARLYFVNGVLRQVFGFTGEREASAPREITPSAGDTFTVLETWLDLDQSGEVLDTASQQGSTLTFGSEMFTWETFDAAVGEYAVGFVVEDLDGNQQQAMTRINVK